MAHLITETDGAVFAGKPAWHGLGIVVEEAPSPREALQIAGLDWTVVKTESVVAGGVETSDYCGLIRSDNSAVLAIMSRDYQPYQNIDLAELAYALGSGVKVESALSMSGGRKIVILLRGDSFRPAGSPNDEVVPYFALVNSHDGSLRVSGMPTSIRVVCNNTLSMALASSKRLFSVKHTGSMESKHEAMDSILRTYAATGEEFRESVTLLASKTLNTEEVQGFWVRVYERLFGSIYANPVDAREEAANAKAADEIAGWSITFDSERKALNAPASLWQAANAVTRSIQHRVGTRGRKATAESRAFNNLLGAQQDATVAVMREALALV